MRITLSDEEKNMLQTSIKQMFAHIETAPHQIRTTHPSDSSGVAFLSRHFAERDTINEEQASLYGIGRLSARVFDLNKWYAEQGMNRRIVCVKKQITKKNGRKAYVTDYYKLEVV